MRSRRWSARNNRPKSRSPPDRSARPPASRERVERIRSRRFTGRGRRCSEPLVRACDAYEGSGAARHPSPPSPRRHPKRASTSFRSRGSRGGRLRGPGASDRSRADYLPALHRGLHDRTARSRADLACPRGRDRQRLSGRGARRALRRGLFDRDHRRTVARCGSCARRSRTRLGPAAGGRWKRWMERTCTLRRDRGYCCGSRRSGTARRATRSRRSNGDTAGRAREAAMDLGRRAGWRGHRNAAPDDSGTLRRNDRKGSVIGRLTLEKHAVRRCPGFLDLSDRSFKTLA